MPGTLFVVATPIGNLEDVSARALRVLREAAVIAAEDTRRTSHLLARFAIATPTTSLHEHNESGKAKSIVDRLVRGEDVALVSDAGTPTVSDPGHALVQAAIDAGIRVEPIPGPNAAIAALAASGFPADRFTFLGFPPTRSRDRKTWFDDLRRIDLAERYLRASGFSTVRVRHFGATARIEVPLEDIERMRDIKERAGRAFAAVGYENIDIDERGYRTGSLNEASPQRM